MTNRLTMTGKFCTDLLGDRRVCGYAGADPAAATRGAKANQPASTG